MNMGCWVVSRMRTAVRRPCGHESGEPMGVVVQSKERISAPISPPPEKKLNFNEILRLARA
jgi:hypothetical protein